MPDHLDIVSSLQLQDENSDSFRLRYLSLLANVLGKDLPVQLHLHDFPDVVSGRLDCWLPDPKSGQLCLNQLATPLGTVPQARIRETDVIAVEFDLPSHDV